MLGRGSPSRLASRLLVSCSVSFYCVSSGRLVGGRLVRGERFLRLISHLSCLISLPPCRRCCISSSPQSSHLAATSIVSRRLPHQANKGTRNRKTENERNGEARHKRRYRTINHLIAFSPDPLLLSLPHLRVLINPPPPGVGGANGDDDRMAGGAMNCVPFLFFLSAPGRSPHGSLSYSSRTRRGVIDAPFLSARLPSK